MGSEQPPAQDEDERFWRVERDHLVWCELVEKESRRSKALGELGEMMRSHEASLQQAEALLGAAGWEGDEQANAIALLEEAEGELKGELKQAEGGRDDGQGKAKAAPAPAQGSRHSRR